MSDNPIKRMTTGAQRIAFAAIELQNIYRHPQLGVNHWLLALMERHAPMLESLLPGIQIDAERTRLRARLSQAEIGAPLDESTLVEEAERHSRARGKDQPVEKDLAQVILTRAGLAPAAPQDSPASGTEIPLQTGSPGATPTLNQFGVNLTRLAQEGKLLPLIGRTDELALTIETLCRRTKRNPVLVGPAGVGKTAIVEGLAQQVVAGNVPPMLSGVRIVSFQPSHLVAGANLAGEFEKRVKALISEASQPGIILFIDEIHSIMGAGGSAGTADFASILKPALARGDLACIAATTDDEYRRFIETDTALERRFQPIRIHELTPEQTFEVLLRHREALQSRYNITADEQILKWLIQFGNQYMRNRHFPDKAVDLLEQSFAHAVVNGKNSLDLASVQEVAQRMVGMPLSLDTRLAALRRNLEKLGLLSSAEIQQLCDRLQVTLRSLDLRPARPNAILLLSGEAAQHTERLAKVIAAALYGADNRTITIDFSRMHHPEDINLLVGAPPGYVGYNDNLPLHQLTQTPWCVLRFENMDDCHPSIRETVAQSLGAGFILDGHGRQLFFSDTVILISAHIQLKTHRNLSFVTADEQPDEDAVYSAIERSLGSDLARQIDLFVSGLQKVNSMEEWLTDHLLHDLALRYQQQGLQVNWDEKLINWLVQQEGKIATDKKWERWVDQNLSPVIIPHLPKPEQSATNTITISVVDGLITIQKT